MSYVTNAEIESFLGTQAYIQLTDDTGTGSADSAKVDQARLGAEAEVNSYLAARYAVPVTLTGEPEAQAMLRSVVLDLVAYRLHGRRPPIPPDIVRRRQEAATWLARVAVGQAHLPAALAPRENPALGLGGKSDKSERMMTRETLADL